jgi:hypothetical protein
MVEEDVRVVVYVEEDDLFTLQKSSKQVILE